MDCAGKKSSWFQAGVLVKGLGDDDCGEFIAPKSHAR